MKNESNQKRIGTSSLSMRTLFGIFVAVLCLLPGNVLYSQSGGDKIQIKGVVTDTDGEPLIGASVVEKGSTNATMTGVDGGYALSVSPSATLVTSYMGYNDKEVSVAGKPVVNIELIEDSKILDEVVVTALGIKKQAKALGYAVTEVKGDDITRGRDGNAITALSGRVAGVDISTGSGGPSGSTRVIIRGATQLTGSNLPLYVVDGVPMDNTQLGSAGQWGGYDLGDGLSTINPEDIESISVLKGASASALYGSRASNGVVLITTKSGKSNKGLGIDVSMNVNAVSILSHFDDYQRVYGQGTNGQPPILVSNAQTSTQSAWGAKLDPNMNVPIFNGETKPYGNVNNNILDFFRTGVTFNNSISLSNSNDKSDVRLSISDMRNNDIVPSSDMYRTTVMLKGGSKLGDKISFEARANYSREGVNNRPALSDSPNNIGNAIIGIAPNFDQKWLANGYKDEFGRYASWNANENRLNPYWVINEMKNISHKDRLMGHAQINYQILPYLSAQIKAGLDLYEFRFKDYAPKYTDGKYSAGRLEQILTTVHENNYEGILTFNKRFNNLDVTAFFGGNIRKYNLEGSLTTGTNEQVRGRDTMANFANVTYEPNDSRKQVNSLFGAVNLGYKDFVYFDFTMRNDVSSTLNKDNRSYVYPSFSGSLVFSELVDLQSIGLNFGKFRASWAKVGGDTDPYKLDLAYGLYPFTINGYSMGHIASEGGLKYMPNDNLKPTSTYSYEFGLDLRFLNNRINLDLGYYSQITKDQIMSMPVSEASGFNYAMINSGEITAKGVEVSLNVIPVQTRDFEWSANVNFSKIVNKIKKLHPDLDSYEQAKATWANAFIYSKEGERYSSIMGRKIKRNPAGEVVFNSQGMPEIEDEVSVLGHGEHDFTMGISNNFRFKDFTFGILLDMKFGGDIYSMSSWMSHYNGTSKNTLDGREEWYVSEEARRAANKTANEWTPTGGYVGKGVVDARTPAQIAAGADPIWEPNTTPVDPQRYWQTLAQNTPEPFIYDASYIKLREMTISYNVPAKALAKTPIKGMTLTAYGRNLFILSTKLKNIDPESSYNNGNGQGFEYGSLPSRRTYGFGVNLKF